MRAKLYSSSVIDIVDDNTFNRMIIDSAKKIEREQKIENDKAYSIAEDGLKKEWKPFSFSPNSEQTKNDNESLKNYVINYYEEDGVIKNKWVEDENVNLNRIELKIREYEDEIRQTDSEILRFFEMMLNGTPLQTIQEYAKDIVEKYLKECKNERF